MTIPPQMHMHIRITKRTEIEEYRVRRTKRRLIRAPLMAATVLAIYLQYYYPQYHQSRQLTGHTCSLGGSVDVRDVVNYWSHVETGSA